MISAVIAMSKNRAIGKSGHLPWQISADLYRFRQLTKGHPIIMGSKTYESLPTQPLPERTNIVLTRDPSKTYEGAYTVTSLKDAFEIAKDSPGSEEIMVIGGEQVFKLALPYLNRIYLTIVDAEIPEADTFLPEFDETRWQKRDGDSFTKDDTNEYSGQFFTYERTDHYPVVEPSNGRNEEYRAQLKRILARGQCPFCPSGETLEDQEIIYKNSSWLVKHNAHPLASTIYHFVIIPVRHFESANDITLDEWADLLKARTWLKQEFCLTGDAMYGRSGEPLITGASVAHFHWHIIIPEQRVDVSFGPFRSL